jgi:hypothetical protein
MHPWYRAETDKPVLQAMVGEVVHWSYLPASEQGL